MSNKICFRKKIFWFRIILMIFISSFFLNNLCYAKKYDDKGFELNTPGEENEGSGSSEEGGGDPPEGPTPPETPTTPSTPTSPESPTPSPRPSEYPGAEEELEGFENELSELEGETDAVTGEEDGSGEGGSEEQGTDTDITAALESAEAEAASAVTAKKDASESAEGQSQLKLAENKKTVEKEKETKKSDKAGDPVKVTEGTYELFETDIESSLLDIFYVKRRYESESSVIGSFGFGWKSNLDERIIIGKDAGYQDLITAENTCIQELKRILIETENSLTSFYKVNSIYTAKNEYFSKISNINSIMQRADILIGDIVSFRSKVSGFMKHEDDAYNLIRQVESFKRELQTKKEKIENVYDSIDEKLVILYELKALIQKEQLQLAVLTSSQQLYNSSNENIKTIFPGMDSHYEEIGSGSVVLFDEDGYPFVFEKKESTSECYYSSEKDFLRLEKKSEGFVLYLANGLVKYFDNAGLITKILDRNNNYVRIIRDENEKITSIENSFAEKWNVNYSGNYIVKLTNVRFPDDFISYSYDNNRLAEVRDRDGDSVKMNYDESGHLWQLLKCDGSYISFTYGEQGADGNILVTSTTDEEGFSEYFEYHKTENYTDYIDHDGNRTRYFYDDKKRTIKKIFSDGSYVQYKYDDNDNLIVTEENGSSTIYAYDEKGNKVIASYEDGSEERWTYDDYNYVISYSDKDGIEEVFHRDAWGNLIEYIKGGVKIYSQEVNSQGQVIKKIINGQHPITTNYSYDSYGNLICEITGNVKKEYEYDARNRITSEKINNTKIREYQYDGHKIIQKNINGLVTSSLTNGRKDVISIINEDSLLHKVKKLYVDYDKRHLPVRVFAGDENKKELVSSYMYTPEGKVCSEILYGPECWIKLYVYQNNKVIEYKQFKVTLSKLGLTKAEFADSISLYRLNELLQMAGDKVFTQKYQYKIASGNYFSIITTDAAGLRTFFEYDAYGNLIRKSIENGESNYFEYSKTGKLTAEQLVQGGIYDYEYNQAGLLIKSSERGGSFWTTDYFPDGSIKSKTEPSGNVENYYYDERGRLICLAAENKSLLYEYDAFDRITKISLGRREYYNQPYDDDSLVYFATFNYSSDNRKVDVVEGGKYKRTYELDAFGNIIKETDGNGNQTLYEYNYKNQLTSFTDAYGNPSYFEYNALGLTDSYTNPENAKFKYEYNHLGLLSKVSCEETVLYYSEYDNSGRLIKEFSSPDSEKNYEYDTAGRLKALLCGDEILESYDYEDHERRITVNDGKGEKYFYQRDSFGRLKEELNRAGYKQKYFYDVDGKVNAVLGFDGKETRLNYSNDKSNLKTLFTDGSVNSFTYDSARNIIEAENSCGKILYQYDKGGRLILQKDTSTGEEISFEYDDAGNRICLKSSNREIHWSYGNNNEIKEVFDNKQKLRVQLKYNKNGQEVLRQFGNGIEEETHYDKSGRIILKMQKSDNGVVNWGEGYVYGKDGKRTSVVDNNCNVTFYEYNKKGQLAAASYPVTELLIQRIKSEAEENGLAVNGEPGENRYLTSGEKAAVIPLLNAMNPGLAFNLSNLQIYIREEYSYDQNGNRKSKTNSYGTIDYTYDKENCLISSGSRGQVFVSYNYDRAGNLLSETSPVKSVTYSYNCQNRLIDCEKINFQEKTYARTSYAYDALNRRVITQDVGEPAIQTIYDGFSFDALRQGPVYENGLYSTSASENSWERTGRPNGDRYRYLDDENQKDGNRYFYIDDGIYKNSSSRFKEERNLLTVNERLTAQNSSEGIQYFSSDMAGSVVTVTDVYGTNRFTYSYDAFGQLLSGNFSAACEFGYLGKVQDPTSKLYNYGYRDYSPATARFTTPDPIRDGTNWFTYCNSDPVNFIDWLGLEISNFWAYSSMSEYEGVAINDTKSTIDKYGCAMTGMANILTEIALQNAPNQQLLDEKTHTGSVKMITPLDLNISSFFNGNTDCLNWNKAANAYGYTATRSSSKSDAQKLIKEATKSTQQQFVLVQVPITIGQGDTKQDLLHWVGYSGNTITKKGTKWVEIVATSDNDAARDKKNSNWLKKDGKMYVKESAIQGAVVVKKKNK